MILQQQRHVVVSSKASGTYRNWRCCQLCQVTPPPRMLEEPPLPVSDIRQDFDEALTIFSIHGLLCLVTYLPPIQSEHQRRRWPWVTVIECSLGLQRTHTYFFLYVRDCMDRPGILLLAPIGITGASPMGGLQCKKIKEPQLSKQHRQFRVSLGHAY
jgi:hypothetical protein